MIFMFAVWFYFKKIQELDGDKDKLVSFKLKLDVILEYGIERKRVWKIL